MGIADSLCSLADLAFHEGDLEQTNQRLTQSLEHWVNISHTTYRYHHSLQGIADCLVVVGK